ncbi:MAG: NADH-quinone oxidoreductase subunit C [Actinomycetia bacterium]|nr:NADH-quinone oxidoreductase subunit C [Actinomycetes bacterium]
MTNYNKTKDLIKKNYSSNDLTVKDNPDSSILISVKNKELIPQLLTFLKNSEFKHLSAVSAIDRIKNKKFELIYNIFSYTLKVRILISVLIERKNPEIDTILSIWPQAQRYEQEIHEFFGIDFPGNPELKGLFLHNWQDIPPLRKDFDTEKYSRAAFEVDKLKK